jgi:hypothetical protein
MSTLTAPRSTANGPDPPVLQHLGEMTVAMLIGMFLYGFLLGSLMAAAGSSLEEARVGQPELSVFGMASSLSVPMVAWIRRRRHGWRNSGEMAAAMFAPAFVLILCYWLPALSASSVCPLACAAMIPAMVAAMLYRLDDYTGHHLVQPATATG